MAAGHRNRNAPPRGYYVTLFLANFDPHSPCHTLSHIPGPHKSTSHISAPRFLVGLVQKPGQKPLYKFSQLFAGVFSRGFCQGSFVRKVLSGVIFVRSTTRETHVLRPLCPPVNIRKYDLRPSPHNFLLPLRDDTNYIPRTLFRWLRPNL